MVLAEFEGAASVTVGAAAPKAVSGIEVCIPSSSPGSSWGEFSKEAPGLQTVLEVVQLITVCGP